MKLKDATRVIGSVGVLLPLILIFLIAADAAYACPGSGTKVVYRTRTAPMGTTLITYRSPAAIVRCGESTYVDRDVRYVKVRRSAPTYIAVRSAERYRPVRQVRYVAVRNADLDDVSRYIAVGRYRTNVDTGTRYVAVRSGYRRGNGIVGYVDVNDSPRYVAMRSVPVNKVLRYVAVRNVRDYQDMSQTRYVAVRDIDSDYDVPSTRYVAVRNVRNACRCADTLRSSLDEIETVRPRHVVVKSDYLAGTEEVILPPSSYDDTAYVSVPTESVGLTSEPEYTDAAFIDDRGRTFVPVNDTGSPCMSQAALRTCSGDLSMEPVAYVPAYDDSDFDDQAILDTDNVTYVADNDIADACLSTVAVRASPDFTTSPMSYVPVDHIDYDTSLGGSNAAYIESENIAPMTSYVPVVDEELVPDAETIYVAANENESCSCPVAVGTLNSDLTADTISYVPASYVADTDIDDDEEMPVETVRYVPVEDLDGVEAQTVSDVPYQTAGYVALNDVDDTNVAEVSHVPIESMGSLASVDETSYVSADVGVPATADLDTDDGPDIETVAAVPPESVDDVATDNDDVDTNDVAVISEPTSLKTVLTEPIAVADIDDAAAFASTQRIGGDNGYRDGFEAGKAAALRLEEFQPGNSPDFQNGTVGYADTYGDIDVYRNAYRSSYLRGFSEGFNSVVSPNG